MAWRTYALLRPSGHVERLNEEEFLQKYAPISDSAARAWWDEAYRAIPKMRTRELHLIGGAILGVWRNIQATGARGMEVVRVPLASGLLSGKYRPGASIPPNDVRAGRERAELDRMLKAVQEIQSNEVPKGAPMAAWALAWCLRDPVVTAVIPGCKSPEQVRDNAAATALDIGQANHPQAA